MNTTITLSVTQTFSLAETFAACIHAMVIRLHHRAISKMDGESDLDVITAEYCEMQAAIRSIQDPLDRAMFVDHIRYHFKKIREEKGTAPTTRLYVAKVLNHRADCIAGDWRIAA